MVLLLALMFLKIMTTIPMIPAAFCHCLLLLFKVLTEDDENVKNKFSISLFLHFLSFVHISLV